MLVSLRNPSDLAWLDQRIARERNAKQRDRYRVVRLALAGEQTLAIVRIVARSRKFVQEWVYRYRDHGPEALTPRKQPGRKAQAAARAAGATAAAARRRPAITRQRLHAARPRRPADHGTGVRRGLQQQRRVRTAAPPGLFFAQAAAQTSQDGRGATAAVQDRFPPFARKLKDQNPGKRIRIFFQDEARVGQQGTLTRVWAPRGSRPAAIRQTEYQWVYLWAAVEPATGRMAGMITPDVNTDRMSLFLEGLSSMLDADDLAIVVLDNAGWHRAKR